MKTDLSPHEVAETLNFMLSVPEIRANDKYFDSVSLATDYMCKIANGELKPVVHARWINMPFNVDNDKYGMNKYNMRIKCTNCGFVTSSDLKYAHCPACAASMDGKETRQNEVEK
jgi:hypothetical protein